MSQNFSVKVLSQAIAGKVELNLPSSRRKFRFYRVILSNGEQEIRFNRIPQNSLQKVLAPYRQDGWKIRTEEISNLTGEIDSPSFSTDHIPQPTPYETVAGKAKDIARHNKMVAKAMAKANRAPKVIEKARVYYRESLEFVGSDSDVINHTIKMINNKTWDADDFVLYLTAKGRKELELD